MATLHAENESELDSDSSSGIEEETDSSADEYQASSTCNVDPCFQDSVFHSDGNPQQRLTYACGTLRSNRKNLPSQLKEQLGTGEAKFWRCDNLVVTHWKDKRDVFAMSSMHGNDCEVIANKRDMCIVNSLLAFTANNPAFKDVYRKHKVFREILAHQLVQKLLDRRANPNVASPPGPDRPAQTNEKRLLGKHFASRHDVRKRCVACSTKRTAEGKYVDKNNYCHKSAKSGLSGPENDIDELNLSFDELNIEGELFVDAAEQEKIRTSTPRTTRRSLFNQFKPTERQEDFAESADAEISKIDDVTMGSSRGIKHDLTPNSKKSNQPRAKRSLVGGKPSGQEITDIKSKIINLLQASFIQQHGSEVNRDILLSSIGLDSGSTSNSLVTRTIKQIFPDLTLRRDRKNDLTFYVNLKHKNPFSCEDSECSRPISDEMINVHHQLGAVEEVLRQIIQQLEIAGEGNVHFEELLKNFVRESNERDELMKTLLKFYQTQAENSAVASPSSLSPDQNAIIAK
ncbi:Hypothetical predicted protein [Paramuricea clavata]|uniref:Uncharacterized protein n=1 Tax=Paramuricea clavata TaxID=317549 RepID=A0A7D9I415_PARCT|nr:Hypothetical predicted protein [Paramuricea clavata]